MKHLIILALMCTTSFTYGQELISAAGNSTSTLTWSMGEVFAANSNNSITIGFNQSQMQITTGVLNIKRHVEVKVYPNPTSDYIHIESEENIKSVSVFNNSGTLIESGKELEINAVNYVSGIYVLQITSVTGKINTYKIIKQ